MNIVSAGGNILQLHLIFASNSQVFISENFLVLSFSAENTPQSKGILVNIIEVPSTFDFGVVHIIKVSELLIYSLIFLKWYPSYPSLVREPRYFQAQVNTCLWFYPNKFDTKCLSNIFNRGYDCVLNDNCFKFHFNLDGGLPGNKHIEFIENWMLEFVSSLNFLSLDWVSPTLLDTGRRINMKKSYIILMDILLLPEFSRLVLI